MSDSNGNSRLFIRPLGVKGNRKAVWCGSCAKFLRYLWYVCSRFIRGISSYVLCGVHRIEQFAVINRS